MKTQAIACLSEGTSDGAGILRFENGDRVGAPVQMVDDDETHRFFNDQGIYLPACCPKSKANRYWLAVEKAPVARIERADIIVF